MATDQKYAGSLATCLDYLKDVLETAVQDRHMKPEKAQQMAAAGAYAVESIEKMLIACSTSRQGYERQDLSIDEQKVLDAAKHQVRILVALGKG
jgi:hypothetical protein